MALTPEEFERLKTLISTIKSLGTKPSDTEPSYLERLKQGFVKESQYVGESFERGQEIAEKGKPIQGMIRTQLGGLGGISRIAFSPITEALSPFITPLVQKATSNEQAQQIIQKIDDWAKKNPDAANNLKDAIDIATTIIGAKGSKVVSKETSKAGKQALISTGKGLKKAGKGAYGITITPQEVTVRAMVAYDKAKPTLTQRLFGKTTTAKAPITEAETAARRGLAGTEYQIGVQGSKIGDDLFSKYIRPKLQATKNAANVNVLIKNVESKINKIADLGRRKDLKDALSTFKEEYKGLNIVSGERLQSLKEDWAQFLSEKTFKTGKPITGAYREIQKMMADEARPILYKIVGEDGKIAYIDYGNLKSITEAGIKSRLSDPAKRTLFRNIWQTLMDKAITPIATFGGKVLYRTGEGLEFIGEKGAKKVGDIIK